MRNWLSRNRKKEGGFSVIELMAGMVIFIGVSIGVTSILVSTSNQVAQNTETTYLTNKVTVGSQIVGKTISEATRIISINPDEVRLEYKDGQAGIIKVDGDKCAVNITRYAADGATVLETSEAIDETSKNTDGQCAVFTGTTEEVNITLNAKDGTNNLISSTVTASVGYYNETNDVGGFTVLAAVDAPQNLGTNTQQGVDAIGRNQISISWDTVTDANNYIVQYSSDNVSWVIADAYVITNTYTLDNLVPETTYYFRVAAKSPAGIGGWSETFEATTLMGSLTTIIQNYNATPDATSISLSWDEPLDNGGYPVEFYTVKYSSDNANWTTYETKTTNYSIMGLNKFTNYYIEVTAHNFKGNSPAVTSTTKTLMTAPSEPTGLTGTALANGTTVSFDWTQSTDNGGSATINYVMEKSTDNTNWTIAGSTENDNTMDINGLNKNTQYYFRLSASNAAGASDYATASETTKSTIPAAPTGLTISEIGADSFNVSWTAPTDTGGLTLSDYSFTIDTNPNFTANPETYSVSETSYQAISLTRATTYYIKVASENSIGVSNSSLSGSVTTLKTVPSIVPLGSINTGYVKIDDDMTATITWSEPTDNGGADVLGYYIYNGSTLVNAILIPAGTSEYVIHGLDELTNYEFFVTAINVVGESSKQDNGLSATTPPFPPSTPSNLEVTSSTKTSMTLSWSPSSGYVDTYTITQDGLPVITLDSASTNYTIEGLSAETSYEITVFATNSTDSSNPATITGYTIPNDVADFIVNSRSSTSLYTTWTANTGNITGYKLYLIVDGTETLVNTLNSPLASAYNFTGLSPLTNYSVKILAYNGSGTNGGEGAASSATARTRISEPTNPVVDPQSITSTGATVSWTAPSGGTPDGYKIYVGGSLTQTITSGTTAILTGLTSGTETAFSVSAYAVVEGVTEESIQVDFSVVTLPSNPSTVNISSTSTSAINISWLAQTGATGYKVYIDGSTTPAKTVTGTSTQITSLMFARSYSIVVKAYNSSGEGTTTPTPVIATTKTSEVTNLMVNTSTSTTADISWTNPSNADEVFGDTQLYSWTVSYSTDGGNNWTTPANGVILAPSTTSYQFTGLTPNTTYKFKVVLTANVIESGGASFSGTQSSLGVTTSALTTIPNDPTNAVQTSATTSNITVGWTAATGATSYKVRINCGASYTDTTVTSPTVTATLSSCNSASLTSGTSYVVQVWSVGLAGTSSGYTEVTGYTTPSNPTSVTASAVTSNTMTISWVHDTTTINTAVSGYKIYSGATLLTTVTTPAITSDPYGKTIRSVNITGLTANTTYANTFKVSPYVSSGSQSYNIGSGTLLASVTTKLAAPTLSGATVTKTTTGITWVAPAGTPTGYKVYRSNDGGATWGISDTILGTTILSYNFGGTTCYNGTATLAACTGANSNAALTPATAYQFKILAYTANGDGDSLIVSRTTTPTQPAAPTFSNVTTSSFDIAWTPSVTNGTQVVGYRIYLNNGGSAASDTKDCGTAVSKQANVSFTTASTATSYSFNGLTSGNRYYALVCAYVTNSATNGWTSADGNQGNKYTTFDAPATLTVSSQTEKTITFSWTAQPSGTATGYKIYNNGVLVDTFLGSVPPASYTLGAVTCYNGTATLGVCTTGYSNPALGSATFNDIEVRAYQTVGGDGELNTILDQTTKAVQGNNSINYYTPTFSSTTTDSTTVSWVANVINGTALTGYYVKAIASTSTVACSALNSSGSVWADGIIAAGVYTASAAGLDSNNTYQVCVYPTSPTGYVVGSKNSVPVTTVPSPPTVPFITSVTPSTATISFTPPTGNATITSYTVEQSANNGAWTASTLQTNPTTTSPVTITGLTSNTNYQFRLKATNSFGVSVASTATNIISTAPSAPTAITTTTFGTTSLVLGWTAPTGGTEDITGYKVEKSSDNISWTTVGYTATTSITVTSLQPSIIYYFRVTASNSAGTVSASSLWGTVSSILTTATTPLAPTNIVLDATSTTLNNAYGNAMDKFGNLYISNVSTHTIIKIKPTGEASVLAGSGTAGSADGTGTAASFNGPTSVAVSADQKYLYVADRSSYKIRQVEIATGIVKTVAGTGATCTTACVDGAGSVATFGSPYGIASDPNNSSILYVADYAGNEIRKVVVGATAALTTVSNLAGSGVAGYANGIGTAATFTGPIGVIVSPDSSKVYVTDYNSGSTAGRVRMITTGGRVVTLIAGGATATSVDNAVGTSATFTGSFALNISPDGNTLYVSEYGASKIRKVALSGTYAVTTLASLSSPMFMPAINANGTYLYGADTVNAIRKISTSSGTNTVSSIYNSSSLNKNAVTIDWTAPVAGTGTVATVTYYKVERSLDGATWTTLSNSVGPTSYYDSNLTAGTQYYYRVSAGNVLTVGGVPSASSIYGPSSTSFTISTPSEPVPAGSVTVTNNQTNTVDVSWQVPTTGNYSGYKVYLYNASASNIPTTLHSVSSLIPVGTNSTSFSGLDADKFYIAEVRVTSPSGIESQGTVGYGATTPLAPTIWSLNPTSTSIQINIIPNSPFQLFNIQKSTDGINWVSSASSSTSGINTVTGLASNTPYYFRVEQIGGETGLSSGYTSATSPLTTTPAPINITSVSGYIGNVSMSWTPSTSTGISYQMVQVFDQAMGMTLNNDDGQYITYISPYDTSFNTAYYFTQGQIWTGNPLYIYVSACNSNGCSDWNYAGAWTQYPLYASYASTNFTNGSDSTILTPSIGGGDGSYSFTASGLPSSVSLNSSTGAITGPSASAWNFKVTKIATGYSSTCGISSGALYCWGTTLGAMGTSYIPKVVSGFESGVTDLSIGYNNSSSRDNICVIKDGDAYCANTTSGIPTNVMGTITAGTASSVVAGDSNSCIVTTGGALYCFGTGVNGINGTGSLTDTTSATTAAIASGVASASNVSLRGSAAQSICAIASGALYCWGKDTNGQVGVGAFENLTFVSSTSSAPSVPSSIAGFVNGENKYLAIIVENSTSATSFGTVATGWTLLTGSSNTTTGQSTRIAYKVLTSSDLATTPSLGTVGGTITRVGMVFSSPSAITSVSEVASAKSHAIALSATANTVTTATSPLTTQGVGLAIKGWVSTAAPTANTMTFTGGTGAAVAGSATTNGAFYSLMPHGTYRTTAIGSITATATVSQGVSYLRIGTAGNNTVYSTPQATSLTTGVTDISTGTDFSCAIQSANTYCWGSNTVGQIGQDTAGTRNSYAVPTVIPTASIAASTSAKLIEGSQAIQHMCTVTTTGTLYCWGNDASGQQGDGTITSTGTFKPSLVSGATTINKVFASGTTTCTLLTNRSVKCWGNAVATSSAIAGVGAVDLVMGNQAPTAFALQYDLSMKNPVFGFGVNSIVANSFGQLGNGTTTSPLGNIIVNAYKPGSELGLGSSGSSVTITMDDGWNPVAYFPITLTSTY